MTLNISYNDDYTVSNGSVSTVTKADRVAARIRAQFLAGESGGADVRLVEPQPITRAELLRIHDPLFVDAVFTGEPVALAESGGVAVWSEELLASLLATNGGARDAAISALEHGVAGSLSSGLHHAKWGMGDGFCTFNGLALMAHAAFDQGCSTVGVLDLDTHCGGGTFDILGTDPRVIIRDLATSGYDSWTAVEDRHTLDIVRDPEKYMLYVEDHLEQLEGIDLLIYNAGMDPADGGGTGSTAGFTTHLLAERERMVAQWSKRTGTPVAFVLAGGYPGRLTIDDIADLHMHTVEAMAAIA